MTQTETPTRQKVRRFNFSSYGLEEMAIGLQLYFGDRIGNVCYSIDAHGMHLATSDDSLAMRPAGGWYYMGPEFNASQLAQVVSDYLDDLSESGDAQRICGSYPTETAYMNDPDLALVGFRMNSEQSRDGQLHSMLTITPAWV